MYHPFRRRQFAWVLLGAFLLLCTLATAQSQSAGKFWESMVDLPKNRAAKDAWIQAQKFHAFKVDHALLSAKLKKTVKLLP